MQGRARSFEVRRSRGVNRFFAVVSLAVAVFLGFGAFALDALLWQIMDGLLAVACAAFAIALWRLPAGTSSPPVLAVRNEGLEFETVGLVRWDEIADVRIYDLPGGGRALGVWPRDDGLVYLRARSRFRRAMAVIDVVFGNVFQSAPLNVPDVLVDDLDALNAEILRRRSSEAGSRRETRTTR